MSQSYQDAFKGTAWYYARYRPGYPEPLLRHVAERFNLAGTGRLLDLGTGAGQLAIPLSGRFEEVVAMDPEPEMLAEAAALAEAAGVTNIRWVEGGSEDLERLRRVPSGGAATPELGTFRLVTMGAS